MNKKSIVLMLLAAMSGYALSGESLTVEPLGKASGKSTPGVRTAEKVALTGPLKIVPMQGALLTLQSTNYGQVILFSPLDVPAPIEQKLQAWATAGVAVKVTGTLNTLCTEQQLKAENLGCRRFDLTKAIIVEHPQ